ncbi:hypothetical protein EPA93_01000 [Ktedonosporobacter rubrisoli]|uniref:Adhesin domain-containing protein n=1 Tax=Ktedonosporobacter rubrisoli TaxID=2509675 RepID=A0A4P6JIA5_KTERU|nr:hypothetical protein [Ktedonosporobacter rubrisoli]QBD74642.1 hypothetical protein EPA93_01000 [Ktedonosporobacter rubrisoli]
MEQLERRPERFREGQSAESQASEPGWSETNSEARTFEPGWMDNRGEKLRPRPPRKRRSGLWIFAIIGILVLLGAAFTFNTHPSERTAKTISHATKSQTFTVSGTPKVNIHNNIGQVVVHQGDGNNVIVNVSQSVNDALDDADTIPGNNIGSTQIKTVQDGDIINVTNSGLFSASDRNDTQDAILDITVPAASDIQIDNQAGNIKIEGVNGQVKASTKIGEIDAENVTLKGDSSLETQAGAIIFNGKLDSTSTDLFNTKTGKVDVTLPNDAAFQLQTSTKIGKVNNEFGGSNAGSGQQAQLKIKTQIGEINLHKGS